MKKFRNMLVLIIMMLFPTIVFAEKCNNSSIKVDGVASFTYCVQAKCELKNGQYTINTIYNNPNIGVICNNGNRNPYYDNNSVSSTCKLKNGEVCNPGEAEACTVTFKYDCSRTSTGAKFTTTKKTTRRRITSKSTTTITTTTTVQKSNTKLKSITLSTGSIEFNPDTYQYNIEVVDTVNTINVAAVPEDSTSKVQVNGNTNITNGSVISILVTGTDNSSSFYKITVKKNEEKELSNNAYLEELSIENYTIPFDSKINDYSLTIDNGVTELNINYKTQDEKATVSITGNNNLQNGSKINIKVTAEDGTENNYILNITVKKQSNFIKVLFIIILILALLAGAYYVYIKFVKNRKSGDKYEYE